MGMLTELVHQVVDDPSGHIRVRIAAGRLDDGVAIRLSAAPRTSAPWATPACLVPVSHARGRLSHWR
jgi:hypothetical protein